jgi:hypothetical protein
MGGQIVSQATFVQLGATRDGVDAYQAAARRRGMHTVLVESPAYLEYRAGLPGRRVFDRQLPVPCPAHEGQVYDILSRAGLKPDLLLAAFDPYVRAGLAVAAALGVAPAIPGVLPPPCDKAAQRAALAARFPEAPQPAHIAVTQPSQLAGALERFPFPGVLKAVNAAGGLAVYAADDAAEVRAAAAHLEGLCNYDGSPFRRLILEERIVGTEFSVQGVARAGQPVLLTFCEKIIDVEPDRGAPDLRGFREVAHIGLPGVDAPREFVALAARCLTAFGYADGPFQIDFIRDAAGRDHFLEMGFRLSGFGLVRLVEQLTGWDWGEVAFGWLFQRRWPEKPPAPRAPCAGQCLLRTPAELTRAETLVRRGVNIDIERFAPPRGPANPALAADLLRHGGTCGRARAVAASVQAIRQTFLAILGRET